MGSEDFTHLERVADVDNAFATARNEAAWEHGHGGYTGTIAEKYDYVVIQRKPVTVQAAYDLAQSLLSAADKRVSDRSGPAGAIPVVFAERFERITIAKYSHPADPGQIQPVLREAALPILRAKRRLRRGEKVTHVRLLRYRQSERVGVRARTDVEAEVTLSKPASRLRPEVVARERPEGWLFVGRAPC